VHLKKCIDERHRDFFRCLILYEKSMRQCDYEKSHQTVGLRFSITESLTGGVPPPSVLLLAGAFEPARYPEACA